MMKHLKALICLTAVFAVAGCLIAQQADAAAKEVPKLPVIVPVEGGTVTRGDNMLSVAGFQISRHEVTQAQYELIMGSNPSLLKDLAHPVENVSWLDAVEFCNRLSIREGLTPVYTFKGAKSDPDGWPKGWKTDSSSHNKISVFGIANGYRLPNDFEWEFAFLGGNKYSGYRFSGGNKLEELGWYIANSDSTHQTVGLKTANELGLFDLCGNVREWVGEKLKSGEARSLGVDRDAVRIVRGSGYLSPEEDCGAEVKNWFDPLYKAPDLGFRVARKLK